MKRPMLLSVAMLGLVAATTVCGSALVAAVDLAPERAMRGSRAAQSLAVPTIPSSQARVTIRRLEGDVTGDCLVNIDDAQQVARRYPSAAGDTAYAAADDIGLPQPDGAIGIGDLQFVVGRKSSSCSSPQPAQAPATGAGMANGSDVTLALDPVASNIWVCDPGHGACGARIPSQVGEGSWQNGIVMNEVMTVNISATIVAYSFELRYDAALFEAPQIDDLGVLNDGGIRTTTCNQTSAGAGDVVFACTSAGPSNAGATWSGPRSVAQVTLTLQAEARQAFSASAGNARISDVDTSAASASSIVTTSSVASVGGRAVVPRPTALAPTSGHGTVLSMAGLAVLTGAIALGGLARRRQGRRA